MKSRTTRRFVVTAATAMTLTLVATGCTGGGSAEEDDNVLTIFAPQAPGMDLETNSFTAILEEEFGVDLQFQTTTQDATASAESRQISLASGDLPDAYMLVPWVNRFTQPELVRLGQQGVIQPLNDLIESDGPLISEAFESVPEYEALATAPDGTIWGLPQWNDCFHCSYNYKLWMNSAWLDAVGMEQPTTPEELREVLRAFKTQDPNGNGVADEIPLSSRGGGDLLPYLMNPFVYMARADAVLGNPASLALDGDEVVLQPTSDGWREGLAFVNSLWEEGLIDDAAFTQNAETLRAKGDNAGTPIVGAVAGQHPGYLVTIGQEDGRDRDYDVVPPLTGPNGSDASYTLPSFPGASFVVTSAATEEEQRILVRIIDYLFDTDNHLRAEFGEEGVGWEAAQEGDSALDPAEEPLFRRLPADTSDKQYMNSLWSARSQYFSSASFRGGQVVPEDPYAQDGLERRLFEATELYEPHRSEQVFPYWNVWLPAETAADVSSVQTNIESLITQASAEFVSGIRDVEDDGAWESFQAEIESLGAETYVSAYQQAYDEAGGN